MSKVDPRVVRVKYTLCIITSAVSSPWYQRVVNVTDPFIPRWRPRESSMPPPAWDEGCRRLTCPHPHTFSSLSIIIHFKGSAPGPDGVIRIAKIPVLTLTPQQSDSPSTASHVHLINPYTRGLHSDRQTDRRTDPRLSFDCFHTSREHFDQIRTTYIWDGWLAPAESNSIPANTRRWVDVGTMLGQRHRRWTNIEPTLAQCLVFLGIAGGILLLLAFSVVSLTDTTNVILILRQCHRRWASAKPKFFHRLLILIPTWSGMSRSQPKLKVHYGCPPFEYYNQCLKHWNI